MNSLRALLVSLHLRRAPPAAPRPARRSRRCSATRRRRAATNPAVTASAATATPTTIQSPARIVVTSAAGCEQCASFVASAGKLPRRADALVASPSRMSPFCAPALAGRVGVVAIAAVVILALHVTRASADLSSPLPAPVSSAPSSCSPQIDGESQQIQQFQGSIDSLQQRLDGVQRSVDAQEQLLRTTTDALTTRAIPAASLRLAFVHDRTALAAQLRAQYESPPPSMVNVVVNAGGFNALDQRPLRHGHAPSRQRADVRPRPDRRSRSSPRRRSGSARSRPVANARPTRSSSSATTSHS